MISYCVSVRNELVEWNIKLMFSDENIFRFFYSISLATTEGSWSG